MLEFLILWPLIVSGILSSVLSQDDLEFFIFIFIFLIFKFLQTKGLGINSLNSSMENGTLFDESIETLGRNNQGSIHCQDIEVLGINDQKVNAKF